LVRVLCDCKTKTEITAEEKEKIQKVLKTISSATGIKIPEIKDIYKPKGCSKCNGLGYRGRTTISEIFVISKEIQELINTNTITSELENKAQELGMITMTQDGILKVLEGETSLAEVERVTDL
jgi:general secretion pathway protein E/type IV pilus assembly protein PilB